jgi:dCMP deaminase
MQRASWSDYLFSLAYLSARRGDCDKKRVGCVIATDDHRIVAVGYNAAPAGTPGCDEVGHLLTPDGHCFRTLHAEDNALVYAGKEARGCTLYTTCIPCYDCTKRIINSGIVSVLYDEFFDNRSQVMNLFHDAGVECCQYDSTGLALFKRLLGSLEEAEEEVKKNTLVVFECGCKSTDDVAGETCSTHPKAIRIRE